MEEQKTLKKQKLVDVMKANHEITKQERAERKAAKKKAKENGENKTVGKVVGTIATYVTSVVAGVAAGVATTLIMASNIDQPPAGMSEVPETPFKVPDETIAVGETT